MKSIGRVMAWCSSNPRAVIIPTALLAVAALLVVAFVPPEVETDVQAGTFPIGDPQADAFRELRREVSGINSELVYLELQENSPLSDVREEAASRDIEALFTYVQTRYEEETGEADVLGYTGYPFFIKLVYSYFPDGSFALPPDSDQYNMARQVFDSTDDGSQDFYFSDNYDATIISILYTAGGDQAAKAGRINDLIAEYRELPASSNGPKKVDLWNHAYMDSWGIYSWIDQVDDSVEKDLSRLVPISVVVLAALLWTAVRGWRTAVLGLASVGLVQLLSLGAMTALGLPVGFVSMALFPLLLGVGVDYVIHVHQDFQDSKGTHRERWMRTGARAGAALGIATATTVAGFLVIMASKSPMIIEISVATVIGMLLVFLMSITVIPAVLTRLPLPASRVRRAVVPMPSKRSTRAIVAVVILAGTALVAPWVADTEFAMDTVEGNLPERPEPSHMRVMYGRFTDQMSADGQESVILRGDLARSTAVDEMIATQEAMEAQTELFDGVLSMPFVMDLYMALEGGGLGPLATIPESILGQIPGAPSQGRWDRVQSLDDQGVRDLLDAMWADERWHPLVGSFTNSEYTITWVFTFLDGSADRAMTEQADEAMLQVMADADLNHLEGEYFGTLTALKRIHDQGERWLVLSAIADLVVLGGLVALVTRSPRTVAATLSTVVLGMVWWLALLASPMFEIRISFVYLIPLAFITSLGSDYAVHLGIALREGRDRGMASVGRAVVYSAVTTGAAFLVFTQASIRGSWEIFVGCVIAIVVSALLSLFWMPLWYPATQATDTEDRSGALRQPLHPTLTD